VIIEVSFSKVFIWTFCVVHTLNVALKNIYVTKNVKGNDIFYGECS